MSGLISSKIYISIFSVLLINFGIFAHNLPGFLQVCKRDDPDLNKCILRLVNVMRPALIKGIPELDIPSCEPLIIDEVRLPNELASEFLNTTFKDVYVWGISNFTINDFDFDKNNLTMRIDLHMPHLTVKTDFQIDGKFFFVPIKQSGSCRVNFTDTDTNITMFLEHEERLGKNYTYCKEILVDYDTSLKFKLDKFFNDTETLNNILSNIVDEHWDILEFMMKPMLKDMISNTFKAYVNAFFKNVPTKDLLLE